MIAPVTEAAWVHNKICNFNGADAHRQSQMVNCDDLTWVRASGHFCC